MTQKMIFVVDDEKLIADTCCAILRCSGYEALAFYDAATALLACDDRRPDFVVTDVSMPGMNGVEMALLLKQRFPQCGFLIVSGHAASAEVLDVALRDGHDFEFIVKPLHPKLLLTKVECAFRRPVQAEMRHLGKDTIAG